MLPLLLGGGWTGGLLQAPSARTSRASAVTISVRDMGDSRGARFYTTESVEIIARDSSITVRQLTGPAQQYNVC